MPGGLIQMAAYGSQDYYLTANPQISFFKTVYRRYTNFSMDFYELFPDTNLGLNDQEVITYKFKITRNADLISRMFFNFTLPDIYSNGGTEFQWVKNIGFNIIDKASIYIGGSLIDEHYGEWFDIWHELTTPLDNIETLNNMIGNIPELYNPAGAPGNNGRYPASNTETGRDNMNIESLPSILSRKIRVPLIFWFNRNPSLALPLISLQYDPIEVHISCKNVTDLYTILDTDAENDNSLGKRIKPNRSDDKKYNSHYSLANFVKDTNIATGPADGRRLINLLIDPILEINYIYLDAKEMKRFAITEHKYLIEQVRQSSFKGELGSSNLTLQIHHPTSLMVIVAKRNDVEDRNDWNNYSNWIDEKIPPYARSYDNIYFEKYLLKDNGEVNNHTTEAATQENYSFRKDPNCLKEMTLKLNGQERFSARDPDFFNYIQSFCFSKSMPKLGIYPYSFSLEPFKYQPSGSCNMSRFNKIELNILTNDSPRAEVSAGVEDNIYKYDINVYTINYNILRIRSGMGNVEFSN